MHKIDEYKVFYDNQNSDSQGKLDKFFHKLEGKITCSYILKKQILTDYKKAILFYDGKVSLDEALSRLSPENLGNFYNSSPKIRFPLDTVAKIYPLAMHNKWMAMFRLSFYMDEDVVPELLQIALSTTIKRFPYFSTTIKKGFFWHYLDTIQTRFAVEQENTYLCEPMNISANMSKLFRVMYRKNRISVEFFHILTDGYGGSEFLKSLVAEYLKLLGHDIQKSTLIKDISHTPPAIETKNDYTKAEKQKKVKGYKDKKALKIAGKTGKVIPTEILHFDMDCTQLKKLAKSLGVSITSLVLGYIIAATAKSTKSKKGNIQIQVPVNMRKLYDSQTLSNFSLFCLISTKKESIRDFKSLVQNVQSQLKEKSTKNMLNEKMCYANRTYKRIKYLPLFLKKYLVRAVFRFIGNNTISTTLSNLGNLELPQDMANHIIKGDACLGPQIHRKISCAMITCNDVTTLSITKTITNKTFEHSIIDQLQRDGIDFKIHGSTQYGK